MHTSMSMMEMEDANEARSTNARNKSKGQKAKERLINNR